MQYRCMYCGEKVNANRFLIKFPLTNDTLLKSWYKNLGLDCDYPPHKSWRLCSDHFTKDGIKLDNKKLISESIPNLFNKRIWKYCACCGVHQYQANCPSFHT
ncbi:uncharacterized protein LOC122508734 [Leptopilina heterotoma]|uniref:uncharacterized protein LOC122508734 n=1 Tax=Leptopilina heterotoma TaxID=63436 RepID=UPI001CA8741A|nr:uncharacterized protein LOC122508734 [Leptopilina heterotoma]